MLISALCDYCDVLEKKGKLPPEGYAKIGISYLIALREDGGLDSIIDRRRPVDQKGKKQQYFEPVDYLLPERPKTTSISGNFVEVRGSYIFGLQYKSDRKSGLEGLTTESEGKTEKQKQKLFLQHKSFAEEVASDFQEIENPSPLVKAYMSFAEKWSPENERDNHLLMALGKDLNSARFAFCLSGHPEIMLQDDPGVRARWNTLSQRSDDTETCQCAIIGRELPVARTHNVVNGIKNAGINPSLVNFKPESFLSYDHKQGTNACISEIAMKKYTKALNWLLSSPTHHNYLDGLTLVYWAADDNEANDDLMQMMLTGSMNQIRAEQMDKELQHLSDNAGNAEISQARLQLLKEKVSIDTDYYIVALAPNSSRIQIKFIYRRRFGNMFESIARHQKDMKLAGQRETIPLWKIKGELVSPKSSRPEETDAMFVSVLKSILQGGHYPVWFLSTAVRRVKTDHNENSEDGKSTFSHLNAVRAGIIKACIIRNQRENITMGLDRENTNSAYLCGRLFAVLQQIQEDSVRPQKLNRTIEDSYFSAASTNPAAIMPKLMRLSQHHMAKLKKSHPDWAVNDNRKINEIVGKLGASFPRNLSLYDQGRFILGYYQQNSARFENKKGEEENA